MFSICAKSHIVAHTDKKKLHTAIPEWYLVCIKVCRIDFNNLVTKMKKILFTIK